MLRPSIFRCQKKRDKSRGQGRGTVFIFPFVFTLTLSPQGRGNNVPSLIRLVASVVGVQEISSIPSGYFDKTSHPSLVMTISFS